MARLGTTAAVLAAMAVLAAAWPAVRAQDDDSSEHEERRIHERWVRVKGPTGEWERAYVVFPFRNDRKDHAEGERYPCVVALHGKGEVAKGPERGPRGWIIDYALPGAYGAFERGTVTAKDYRGFVTKDHLALVGAEMRAHAFEGLMVIAPYVRDPSDADSGVSVQKYADWVAGPLLEQVRAEYPGAARGRGSLGVDGVSLGGWLSLETGFRHPEVFGAVGGIQPAIRGEETQLANRAAAARKRGLSQSIRLLTSQDDPYQKATRKLSSLLRKRHVPHDLLVLPGPHDYEFNRGPGAMELVRFGTRALKREPMPAEPAR